MWARQVVGCSPEVIEQFFAEWISNSHFMPGYADWTEWLEARNERESHERAAREYEAYKVTHAEAVRQWRESPEYVRDMAAIHARLEALEIEKAPMAKLTSVQHIPLAYSAEKEREIIAGYASKKDAE